ncbi:hypothetical protein JAAARDRAFT_192726 [Jaapia argillacea MUCL 33604]|uniref:Uncharacterized protein n=1 Tax=Jaapia argillacea MUCL 33604 TaxID=933084 RepID=A0A067Q9B9_9AGAM|nr:hypothetical protein JAAARDRAFT_192726 [Jaapia argillacea MUCL 33604]
MTLELAVTKRRKRSRQPVDPCLGVYTFPSSPKPLVQPGGNVGNGPSIIPGHPQPTPRRVFKSDPAVVLPSPPPPPSPKKAPLVLPDSSHSRLEETFGDRDHDLPRVVTVEEFLKAANVSTRKLTRYDRRRRPAVVDLHDYPQDELQDSGEENCQVSLPPRKRRRRYSREDTWSGADISVSGGRKLPQQDFPPRRRKKQGRPLADRMQRAALLSHVEVQPVLPQEALNPNRLPLSFFPVEMQTTPTKTSGPSQTALVARRTKSLFRAPSGFYGCQGRTPSPLGRRLQPVTVWQRVAQSSLQGTKTSSGPAKKVATELRRGCLPLQFVPLEELEKVVAQKQTSIRHNTNCPYPSPTIIAAANTVLYSIVPKQVRFSSPVCAPILLPFTYAGTPVPAVSTHVSSVLGDDPVVPSLDIVLPLDALEFPAVPKSHFNDETLPCTPKSSLPAKNLALSIGPPTSEIHRSDPQTLQDQVPSLPSPQICQEHIPVSASQKPLKTLASFLDQFRETARQATQLQSSSTRSASRRNLSGRRPKPSSVVNSRSESKKIGASAVKSSRLRTISSMPIPRSPLPYQPRSAHESAGVPSYLAHPQTLSSPRSAHLPSSVAGHDSNKIWMPMKSLSLLPNRLPAGYASSPLSKKSLSRRSSPFTHKQPLQDDSTLCSSPSKYSRAESIVQPLSVATRDDMQLFPTLRPVLPARPAPFNKDSSSVLMLLAHSPRIMLSYPNDNLEEPPNLHEDYNPPSLESGVDLFAGLWSM